jgi:hypothetical protein
MGWASSTHGSYEKCIQIFVENTAGKTPLGRPRHRCEDNIGICLREIG